MEYGSLRVEVCGIWFLKWRCVEYGSESGGVWYIAQVVEGCGIWLWEWRCVVYGSESGGVWYIVIETSFHSNV